MKELEYFLSYLNLDFKAFREEAGYSFQTWKNGEWQLQDRGSYYTLNKGGNVIDDRITITFKKG